MAAAFFNQMADPTKVYAWSAGTQPANKVHDSVVSAMQDLGIDLSNIKPQLLTEELATGADLLITMGCGETCPYLPRVKRQDWTLPDPKNKSDAQVCAIRDEIKARVTELLNDLGITNSYCVKEPGI